MNANDLLLRALEAYDHEDEPYFERLHHAFEDIRAYLDAPEMKDEPVECIHVPLSIWKYLKEGTITADDLAEAVRKANAEEKLHPPTKTAPKKIDDNFGSKQLFKDIAKHSHVIDIHVRYSGAWYQFEGDWLKEVLPGIEFNQIDNQGIKAELETHKLGEYPTKTAPKPMTEKEIAKNDMYDGFNGMFYEGIRFAERHHGIGGGDV